MTPSFFIAITNNNVYIIPGNKFSGERILKKDVFLEITIAIIIVISLFLTSTAKITLIQTHETEIVNNQNIDNINVGLYDTWGVNNYFIMNILNYSWTKNNQTYQFNVTIIDKDDIIGIGNISLTKENFDVFIIGASAASYLIDSFDEKWSENVKQFVASGGGYIGICGGANAASMGFENSINPFHKRVNNGVLELIDVHINDDFMGEWQYLLKFGFDAYLWDNNELEPSYISINTTVEKNTENLIFSESNHKYRHLSYAGGPGMYPANSGNELYGQLIPILTYNEEPMYTKPLHYWRPSLGGWKIFQNITTSLNGTFACVASTYNNSGRVVVYGPHPESEVVVDGYLEEYLGHSMINFILPFKTYVFTYFGTPLDYDYNWGMLQRSVAWAAQLPDGNLPPL